MNNYIFFYRQYLPFIFLMPLWLMFTQKVYAGAIEVSIDHYNSSRSDYTDKIDLDNNNQFSNYRPSPLNLPTNNENITIEGIYYVKGNLTPPPPTIINGNLTSSNKILPPVPPLAQPYSAQQNSEVKSSNLTPSNNPSNNLSLSVSPFDITPQEEKPISPVVSPQVTINNINNNGIRTINLSPNNKDATAIKSSPTNSQDSNDLGKRRNLRDILVFSEPSNTILPQNNGNNLPSVTATPSVINNQKVYKVLAQINNNQQETGVKSLYPEAFKTNYQGQLLLQVGVFSNRERAEQVSQSLISIGVRPVIIP